MHLALLPTVILAAALTETVVNGQQGEHCYGGHGGEQHLVDDTSGCQSLDDCRCSNDPHCVTFDGRRNEHHIPCRSRFVHKCPETDWPFPDIPEFEILAENTWCNPANPMPPTCVDRLDIIFGDITVILSKTLGVQIQVGAGALINVAASCLAAGWPSAGCAPAAPPGTLISVQRVVNEVVVILNLTGVGDLTVTMSQHHFSIKINGEAARDQLYGVLCGNCGRYNGNGTDDLDNMTLADFQLSHIVDPDNCDAIGNGLMAGTGSKSALPTEFTDRCADASILADVMATCDIINDPGGPFGVCFGIADRELFWEDCVTDTCLDEMFLEANLAGYAASCGAFGFVGPWRAILGLPFTCPDTMFYTSCYFSCFKTCQFPGPCLPPEPCVEGCACMNDAHVYDSVSNACIPREKCGTTEATGFDDWGGIGRFGDASFQFTPCDEFDTSELHCEKHGYCFPPGTILTTETCDRHCACKANKKGTKAKWKCGKKLKKAADKEACEMCAKDEEGCDENIKFLSGMQGCLSGKGKVCVADVKTCLQGEIDLLQLFKKKDNKLVTNTCE